MESPKKKKSDIKSVVVLPSRSRPENLSRTLESVLEKTASSDILVAIDEDQQDLYTSRLEGVIYDIGPAPQHIGVNAKLNRLANQLKDEYDYLLWAADDTLIKTNKWDTLLIKAISDIRYGISHPEENTHDQRLLPSNGTCFDLRIVRTLGYLAPPTLKHLYIDNFWKRLGTDLGSIRFVPKVKIDHIHFTKDINLFDPLYAATNSRNRYEQDKQSFDIYLDHQLKHDLAKLRAHAFDDDKNS